MNWYKFRIKIEKKLYSHYLRADNMISAINKISSLTLHDILDLPEYNPTRTLTKEEIYSVTTVL